MTNNQFEAVTIDQLDALGSADRDALTFGVIGFDNDTIVDTYNAMEAQMAGLDPASVIGAPFFSVTAQCMNNFMVAQRFEDEPELDAIIPYV